MASRFLSTHSLGSHPVGQWLVHLSFLGVTLAASSVTAQYVDPGIVPQPWMQQYPPPYSPMAPMCQPNSYGMMGEPAYCSGYPLMDPNVPPWSPWNGGWENTPLRERSTYERESRIRDHDRDDYSRRSSDRSSRSSDRGSSDRQSNSGGGNPWERLERKQAEGRQKNKAQQEPVVVPDQLDVKDFDPNQEEAEVDTLVKESADRSGGKTISAPAVAPQTRPEPPPPPPPMEVPPAPIPPVVTKPQPQSQPKQDHEMEAGITVPGVRTKDCADCEATGPLTLATQSLADIAAEIGKSTNQAPAIGRQLAIAGRTILASFYQSCQALNVYLTANFGFKGVRMPEDEEITHGVNPGNFLKNIPEIVAQQPYLQGTGGPNCRDMTKTLPAFHNGVVPKFTSEKGKLKINYFTPIKTSSGENIVASDCRGFICGAFARAQLKLRAGVVKTYSCPSTLELLENKGYNCLERPQFSANDSLRQGDVIVARASDRIYGHSLMIDQVGDDPFGLNAIQNKSQCSASTLDPRKFKFTVIQSTGSFGRMAVMRITASEYAKKKNSSLMMPLMVEMAAKACLAKFGEAKTAEIKDAGQSVFGAVLRHKGTAECIDGRRDARVEGEECIQGCAELYQ